MDRIARAIPVVLNPSLPNPKRPSSGALRALLARAVTLCLLVASVPLHAATLVRYPLPEAEGDRRDDYPVALLALILQKAGGQMRPVPSGERWSQARTLVHLAEGRDIDVAWSMTSVAREQQLLPIRIPIFKGLIGWRIALVRRGQEQILANARTPKDIDSLVAGQGQDWPDKEILRGNGLPVVDSTSYDGLFRMLAGGRFDYFPRSVAEITAEARVHRQALAIEPNVVLRYPTAAYFFVKPGNTKLAAVIRRGFERAVADGSADALFNEHFGETLRALNLSGRRVIDLTNPILPAGVPLDRKELWYHP